MNARTRLFLSIGIPVLLVIVVVGAFLWQQRAAGSGSTVHVAPWANCTSLAKSAPKQLTAMNLALDWTPNTNHTGIYVAQAEGWYRAEGIDLHLLPYSANVSSDVLVSSGKADVGVSSTEGIVADAAVGQPVVSIAAIIQHNTSALVTLASSGLNRPRDLDGKIAMELVAPKKPVGGAFLLALRQRVAFVVQRLRLSEAAARVGPDRRRLCMRRERHRRADPHCENCRERLAIFIHMNAPNCYCAREKKAADAALFR